MFAHGKFSRGQSGRIHGTRPMGFKVEKRKRMSMPFGIMLAPGKPALICWKQEGVMSGAIIMWQYQCMRAFRKAGAIDASSAKPLAQIGCRDSVTLRCLVRNKVIVQAASGYFYLDLAAADRYYRRVLIFSFAVAALIILLLIWLRVF
jgi:hypothetical protein